MSPELHAVFQTWSVPLGLDATLLLTVLIYLRGWFRVRAVSANLIPAWRLGAFLAGVFSVWIAIGSPLDAFDEVLLTIHMAQHLLLMAIAPPLILLGAPALPLLQGIPQSVARDVVGPFLRWRFVKWLGHFVSNPAIGWFAAISALIAWHIPAIFDLALRLPWLHVVEHATFFVTGILFWWPVVQPWPSAARWPRWSIPLYLFCATLPCDVLSGFLAFCDRVVYSSYLSAPRVLGMSPLQDQQCAGAVMWVAVTVIFLIPAVVVTLHILSPRRNHFARDSFVELSASASRPLEVPDAKVL
ncbi:MAG TPA: cytochrome c oxidase assembly protein [Candidatus Acidoferrales bacterium]